MTDFKFRPTHDEVIRKNLLLLIRMGQMEAAKALANKADWELAYLINTKRMDEEVRRLIELGKKGGK